MALLDYVPIAWRTGASRTIPEGPTQPEAEAPPRPTHKAQALALDFNRISQIVDDPIFTAISGFWADRQQHGREQYEAMLSHPVVHAAIQSRIALLMSHRPRARPPSEDPTPTQQLLSDWLNHSIKTMDWHQFIDGTIGGGLRYGFTLTEKETSIHKWRGSDHAMLDRLVVLPQATLDDGHTIRDGFSTSGLRSHTNYRCFNLTPSGKVRRIIQLANSSVDGKRREWFGPTLKYITHHKHMGSDGNPFGQSALWAAYRAWATLYFMEKLEEVFLDTGLPIPVIGYKTADGQPRPALHNEITETLSQHPLDAAGRTIIGPDLQPSVLVPTNPDFKAHVESVIRRKEQQIWQAVGVPRSLTSESIGENEADVRNLTTIYFKHGIVPDLLETERTFWDIFKPIAASNFSNIQAEDWPILEWNTVSPDDLRNMQTIFQATLPHAASDKIGDFVNAFSPFNIDPRLYAREHEDSVSQKRPLSDKDDDAATGQPAPNDPPPKQDGERRVRLDGATDNPSTDPGAPAA